jgi:hypothetical protein
MSGDPKPLDKEAKIQGFVPDSSCAWVVVYAGPCLDPHCDEQHDRLYIVPMIGWLQAIYNGFEVRPAVMTADGTVNDYLDMPKTFKFVAVLQESDNVVDLAHIIYHKRYGDSLDLDSVVGVVSSLPN